MPVPPPSESRPPETRPSETRPSGIRLTNSLTRRKEAFAPLDPANVRMYVCGPTVYDRAHLGNARPVVVFDVLFRLLRHVYGADHVTYVRNFTDVDDKINAEALRRQQAGASGTLEALIRERTEETIRWYHEDMDALGALRPTHEPRATEYIAAMVAMIRRLVAQGHAYAAEGHVLFRVRSYRGYGALSGRTVDDMLAGARVEVAPFKEDPLDFVLWKPSDAALPGWDSPWGRGRPGWHIECSAMSRELLGESFDIHGGGLDLQFPHHENEIAQSRCAHPEGGFAKLWLHNEMLLVEGRKMSKSLGNFFTVRDLLNQHIDGEVIRYVFLMTHYRKPMDWTTQKLETATALLRRWGSIRHRLASAEIAPRYSPDLVDAEVLAALADDLNTPLALSHLIRLGQDLYYEKTASDAVNRFFSTLQLLGFERLDPDGPAIKATVVRAFQAARRIDPLVERLRELRAAKNWAEADKLRDRLRDAGLKLRMNKDGTIVWEHSPNLNMDRLEAIE